MIQQHIINFKSFTDESERVLSDLKNKIFEYEKMLHYKKINYNQMFFLKKIFDKKETSEINELIEIIQEFTYNMKETQSAYDSKKREFFELYKSYMLDENAEFSQQYKKTKLEFKNIKRVHDMMDESLKIGKSSIEWFQTSIKNFNEFNKFHHTMNVSPVIHKAFLAELNDCLGKSIAFVSRFKKNVIYGKEQIQIIAPNINLDGWATLISVIEKDNSENIILSNFFNKMSSSKNINEINNTLAILQTAYKSIKNEIDILSEDYNESKQRYERLDIELNILVDNDLKKANLILSI